MPDRDVKTLRLRIRGSTPRGPLSTTYIPDNDIREQVGRQARFNLLSIRSELDEALRGKVESVFVLTSPRQAVERVIKARKV